MSTLLRFYGFSLVFTAICLGLATWYGWASTGTITGTLSLLWIVAVLSVLEISLSFDNAVVNASVLKEMDEVWQRRFLTWGIAFAVFGMRIVFPLAIVAIAAGLGPLETINLSLNDPKEYERIVSSAHVGIAGFGGATESCPFAGDAPCVVTRGSNTVTSTWTSPSFSSRHLMAWDHAQGRAP